MNTIVLKATLISLVFTAIYAVPNYHAPKNIIAAAQQGNPYWFFRLDADKIALARQHAAMRTELLDRVAQELQEYRQSVQDRAQGQPLDQETARALAMLEKSYATLRKDFSAPGTEEQPQKRRMSKPCSAPLSAQDRSALERLFTQPPAELLAPITAPRKKLMGAAGPHLEDFQRRAEVEQQYAALIKRVRAYAGCLNSKYDDARQLIADKQLIGRVSARLEEIYATVLDTEHLHI